ncbi:MAG: helix-turn-helix transcriptional regulator [Clostridia bacterium]|nr:helix-turn-helix transcriptional regulator [Clostridia bacterium]
MKLNFAENLRKLRRERGFTQEVLSEKLGVSFQTVSRWENGVVYPDIELLPVIADFFEIRVDELLGCTKEDKEKNLQKRWEEYEKLCEPEEQYAFLKAMKRDFPKVYLIPYYMLRIMYIDHIHTDELCAVFEDFSALCTDKMYIDWAQEMYIGMEEEHALKVYTEKSGLSDSDIEKYLEKRYFYRKEWKKYDLQRQLNLCHRIQEICFEELRKRDPLSAENSAWAMKKALEMLNLFSDTDGENSVMGGKGLDLWFADRYMLGFRLAAALAVTGRKEEAYKALEESVEIIEQISVLPEGAILRYHSPTLDRITGRLTTGYRSNGEMYKHFSLYDGEEALDRGFTAFLANDLNFLEERKGWEWFDSIRGEERYRALTERFKKAVI